MRVAVLHNSLNPTGGAERLCVSVIEAVKERGHHVTLFTFETTDWQKVERNFGAVARPDHEATALSIPVRGFSIYQRLFGLVRLRRQLARYDYSINTHGDMVPIPCDLTYMHFPTYLLQMELHSPANAKYRASALWRMYYTPYDAIKGALIRDYATHGHIVTNSTYSRDVIHRLIGITPDVVYPPVDTSTFQQATKGGERKSLVVTCSRISPEKHLELVPQLARLTPEVEFALIGSTSYISGDTLHAIHAAAKGLDNFTLYTDFSQAKLLTLYGEASVYFHPMKNEHFGISIVEAMASGLRPLVHRSGGPWRDILAGGRYGYGFSDLDEASHTIRRVVDDHTSRDVFVERAHRFDRDHFKSAIQELVC